MYLANELEKKLQDIKNTIPNIETGGGGESDFSINKLVLNYGPAAGAAEFFVPVILDSPEGLALFPRIGSPDEYDVVVYSNGTIAMCTVDADLTVSGNITLVAPKIYLITGDCVITVND